MAFATRSFDQRLKQGQACIKAYAKTLDRSPGVYRMLDKVGRVLYVGKAKNLKNRVASYTRFVSNTRIARMVSQTDSMMFLTTRSEAEALLLEQNLIKQLKPHYNVLLRDGKSFPFICLAKTTDFAELKHHRGKKADSHSYYGPFANAAAVRRTINQLQRVFLLRTCSDNIFFNRTRPCLLYQIKRCAAPCVDYINKTDYAALVRDAERFLKGQSTEIQTKLAQDMNTASNNMDYERAAALRDRIRALSHIHSKQAINPRTTPDADVIAVHCEHGQACVQIFFIRGHQNWGNQDYYPTTGEGAEAEEILETFIGQFYTKRFPPRLVLLSHVLDNTALLAQFLSEKCGHNVSLLTPKRGERLTLVQEAHRNAGQSLARRLSERATQTRLLQALAKCLHLPAPPQRIEVYDNSHIQGSHAIGVMIVAGAQGFEKNQYRKFTIKDTELTPGDDFAMMHHVLDRRCKRLLKEHPNADNNSAWPDVLLIDGGKGQVNAAYAVLKGHAIDHIPVFGVAKGVERNAGRERFYAPQSEQPIVLAADNPVLYFIQRLRDEAHRFAIGGHRAKRTRAISDNPLDNITGVGSTRKMALLSHFGSARAVSQAGEADLRTVRGISARLAKTIFDYFHE